VSGVIVALRRVALSGVAVHIGLFGLAGGLLRFQRRTAEADVDIAQLAVQYCVAHEDIATTIAGSANPENVRKWAKWAETPMDEELIEDVLAIIEPVKNIGHVEGLLKNN
jgi:hypothetical protein